MIDWYRDWQSQAHVVQFDFRAPLSTRNLVRNFESFNDVRLLNEWIARPRSLRLVEIGCATGEFYRYLRFCYPSLQYYGIDISGPAIAQARAKYPQACFLLGHADGKLLDALRALSITDRPEVIYAKDVVHHQTHPLAFMAELLEQASEAVIMRLRTRDVGATEWDPLQSCQYHYDGWMPYIVMNLQEVIDHLRQTVPDGEIMVYRHHMILGGRVNRFLPKDCYLKETGTGETAVGVFFRTAKPGQVTIRDQDDERPRYTLGYRLRHAISVGLQEWR